MFEYRVEVYMVKDAERAMNLLAMDGWRVIAVTPDHAKGYGIIVTFEREIV